MEHPQKRTKRTKSDPVDSLPYLPNEMWVAILSYTAPITIVAFSQVSIRFSSVAKMSCLWSGIQKTLQYVEVSKYAQVDQWKKCMISLYCQKCRWPYVRPPYHCWRCDTFFCTNCSSKLQSSECRDCYTCCICYEYPNKRLQTCMRCGKRCCSDCFADKHCMDQIYRFKQMTTQFIQN
mmetsp:Transcript_21654/g.24164  ORF Transcript_21654/g.24164 Transcript_21654/m.24164 type:complete len:178 (-) Transcript_21654:101-634(-)